MIHLSELDINTVTKPEEVVKKDDKVDFIVLSVNAEERRFSLSRKAHLKGLEGENLKEYLDSFTEPQTAFANAFSQAKTVQTEKEEKEENDNNK